VNQLEGFLFQEYYNSVVSMDEERQIVSLLETSYNEQIGSIDVREEMKFRLLVYCKENLIGHGEGYTRTMSIGDYQFTAGIVGGIAVDTSFRNRGIAKNIIAKIHRNFINSGVQHSFLFASIPQVYISSGYRMLENEMHAFDISQNCWVQWVWHNSMVADLTETILPQGVLEFNGRTY